MNIYIPLELLSEIEDVLQYDRLIKNKTISNYIIKILEYFYNDDEILSFNLFHNCYYMSQNLQIVEIAQAYLEDDYLSFLDLVKEKLVLYGFMCHNRSDALNYLIQVYINLKNNKIL